MTATEAKDIIKLIKSGKIFKIGEYASGLVEYYYEDDSESFVEHAENSSEDVYNPESSIRYFTEAEFKKYIEKNYEFDIFMSGLIE